MAISLGILTQHFQTNPRQISSNFDPQPLHILSSLFSALPARIGSTWTCQQPDQGQLAASRGFAYLSRMTRMTTQSTHIISMNFRQWSSMIWYDLVASDFPWDVSSCFFAEIHQIQGRVASASSWGGAGCCGRTSSCGSSRPEPYRSLQRACCDRQVPGCFGATHGAKACHMKAY